LAQASPTLGGVIRRFGDALREQRGDAMTYAQEAVLGALGRCHTAALGGHVYQCDTCAAERIAYNGCGNRHCPSCLSHKSAAWLEARVEELLPVPYFHVVFTVPQEVGALALGNKSVVYTLLFRAAAETLLEVAERRLKVRVGFLAVLHTWTQTLQHHPHVHCVVPGGGLSLDGSAWIASRSDFLVPVRVLSLVFRAKFLELLDEAVRQKQLRLSVAARGGASWSTEIRRRLRKMSWVVYAKAPFGSPEQVLKYLARYTHRVAISNRRIRWFDDTDVCFSYRDREHGNVSREMKLAGAEFLRRFLLHVLPRGFVRIRYYGWLSSRSRSPALDQCRQLLGAPPRVPSAPVVAAEEDARELDDCDGDVRAPRCPVCQTGHLRVVADLAPAPELVLSLLPRPRALQGDPDTS
jgi:hypothetical protein